VIQGGVVHLNGDVVASFSTRRRGLGLLIPSGEL
jgi:hypothetical protein